MSSFLIRLASLGIVTSMLQFSAQTNAKKFQAALISRLTRKSQNAFGAPKNKWNLIFIDDLNMPIPDQFGDQSVFESIRYINENSKRKLFFEL